MKLNYQFKDPQLLEIALTHPSLTKDKQFKSYETLEFLGDNIINFILAEALYLAFPQFDEGKLSQIHANLACTKTLSQIAANLNLGEVMNLDKGEEANGGRKNEKNLENCLEALIAAVYLDSDFYNTRSIFLPYWQPFIDNMEYVLKRDAKSLVQEWSQKLKYGLPKYTLIEESGLAHHKSFTVSINVENYVSAIGNGSSIKKAEIEAAENFIKLNGIESV